MSRCKTLETYGKELILDLRDCDPGRMTRQAIRIFMRSACAKMQVEACDLHFWDDEGVAPEECQTDPKRKGVSAVQFLLTSSIVLHALELRREVYLNLFSCENFDDRVLADLALRFFGGRIIWRHVIHRGLSDTTLRTHPDDIDVLIVAFDRIMKLCDWAVEHCDDLTPDPLGVVSLNIDYEDLRNAVNGIEPDLFKAGLLKTRRGPGPKPACLVSGY
jgi:S-adenosylmethionine/arginine decarboxylase-like enzyme